MHVTRLIASPFLAWTAVIQNAMPWSQVYMGKLKSMSQGDKKYRSQGTGFHYFTHSDFNGPFLTCALILLARLKFLPWGWRQQIPPKRWNQSTKLHGVTFHKRVWVPLYVRAATGSNLKRGTGYNSQGLRWDPYIFHKILRTVSRYTTTPVSHILRNF